MISRGISSASTPGNGGGGIFTVTVSPASSRCEDFLTEPSTRTRPSSMRLCTWVRLMSLSCVARKRSRRSPADSSLTAKASCSEESSSDSKWSCISNGVNIEVLKIGSNRHLAGDRGTSMGNGGHGWPLQPAPPKRRANNNQGEAHQLHQRDGIVEHHRAPWVAPEKFDGTALSPVEQKISGDDLSGKALPFADPNQNKEINKLRGSFVKLRGMQMNAQGSPGYLRGSRIRKHHAPGDRRRLAVAASRGKTTQAANSMTEWQSCPKSVHYREQRHFLKIRIQANHQDSADDTAVKSSAGLKGVQTENIARIGNVVVPVAQDEPDLGQKQRDENCVDPHVPDFVGIESSAGSLFACPPESC